MRLDLLIPTYNRPGMLARLLRHYARMGVEFPVVVADSSRPDVLEANAQVVRSLRDRLTVEHLTFDGSTSPFRKIAEALKTRSADLAAMCADDDFLVPTSVQSCAEFLTANPDHSVAHGRSVIVEIGEVDTVTDLSDSFEYDQCEQQSPDPRERLRQHLASYSTTFYSVHRRAQLAENFAVAASVTDDYQFGELLPSCLSMIQGKARRMDCLYMVRTEHLKRASTTEVNGVMRDWPALVIEDDYSAKYSRFRKVLADALKTAEPHRAAPEQAVNEAFVEYLGQRLAQRPLTIRRVADLVGKSPTLARGVPRLLSNVLSSPERRSTLFKRPRSAYRALVRASDHFALHRLTASSSPFAADFAPILATLESRE